VYRDKATGKVISAEEYTEQVGTLCDDVLFAWFSSLRLK
jgi:hypothetical protein